MKKYNPLLKEDFSLGSELKVISSVCSIIGRKVGGHLSVSTIPLKYNSDVGKVEGITAFFNDGRRIRFDFHIGDSSKIIAVHFWKGFHTQPDFTMPLHDKNIVQVIDAIVYVLQSGQADEMVLTEDVVVTSKTQGKVSKDISDAINAWATQMELGEHDLQNRRIKDLYKSYLYWIEHVETSAGYKTVSESAFRDYIIQYLAKYNLTNIFMRKIVVNKAGKEHSITSDEPQAKKFDSEIMKMTLDDQLDFIRLMARAVAQGRKNSLIVCGTPGTGKSRTIKEIVHEEKGGRKVIEDTGLISKANDLYKFLYKFKDHGNIIVFDDTRVIEEKAFRPFLLSVLSPEKKRLLTNREERYVDPNSLAALDTKKVPDSFEFEASVIVITNTPKRKIDSAIASRTTPIELNVTKSAIVDSIRVNLPKILSEYKEFGEVEEKQALELLDFIEAHLQYVDHIDFRIFKECLAMVATLPPNNRWKQYVMFVLQDYR